MDSYLRTIKFILSKENIPNEDNELNDFFANGKSFPKFVSTIFHETIPGIKWSDQLTIFQRNTNNSATLDYLRKKNPFFGSLSVDFKDPKNQILLVNLILNKICFKITRTQLIQRCNNCLKNSNQKISNFSEFSEGQGFVKLFNAISNFQESITISTGNADLKFQEISKYLQQFKIYSVIDASSFNQLNHDILMYQALIILDSHDFSNTSDVKTCNLADENTQNPSLKESPQPSVKEVQASEPEDKDLDNQNHLTESGTSNNPLHESLQKENITEEQDCSANITNNRIQLINPNNESSKSDDQVNQSFQEPQQLEQSPKPPGAPDNNTQQENATTENISSSNTFNQQLGQDSSETLPEKDLKPKTILHNNLNNENKSEQQEANLELHHSTKVSISLDSIPSNYDSTFQVINQPSETNLSLSDNSFSSSSLLHLPGSSYLNIVNYLMELTNQPQLIVLKELDNGTSFPAIIQYFGKEPIQDLMENPDISHDRFMNNITSLYYLKSNIPDFSPRAFNLTNEDDLIKLIQIIIQHYVLTDEFLDTMSKQCNDILSNIGLKVTNLDSNWENGEYFLQLLNYLTYDKYHFRYSEELTIEDLKDMFIKAHCPAIIEADSIISNLDDFVIQYQISLILTEIQNRRGILESKIPNEEQINTEATNINDNRCKEDPSEEKTEISPILSKELLEKKLNPQEQSTDSSHIKHTTQVDINDTKQKNESPISDRLNEDATLSNDSKSRFVYEKNLHPLLRILNAIAHDIDLHYNNFDEVINEMTIALLVGHVLNVQSIPGVNKKRAFANTNSNAVLNFLKEKNTMFKYSSFDFNQKEYREDTIIRFIKTLLDQFFLKYKTREMFAKLSEYYGEEVNSSNYKSIFLFGNGFFRLLGNFDHKNTQVYDEKSLLETFEMVNVPYILDEDCLISLKENYVSYQIQFIFNTISKPFKCDKSQKSDNTSPPIESPDQSIEDNYENETIEFETSDKEHKSEEEEPEDNSIIGQKVSEFEDIEESNLDDSPRQNDKTPNKIDLLSSIISKQLSANENIHHTKVQSADDDSPPTLTLYSFKPSFVEDQEFEDRISNSISSLLQNKLQLVESLTENVIDPTIHLNSTIETTPIFGYKMHLGRWIYFSNNWPDFLKKNNITPNKQIKILLMTPMIIDSDNSQDTYRFLSTLVGASIISQFSYVASVQAISFQQKDTIVIAFQICYKNTSKQKHIIDNMQTFLERFADLIIALYPSSQMTDISHFHNTALYHRSMSTNSKECPMIILFSYPIPTKDGKEVEKSHSAEFQKDVSNDLLNLEFANSILESFQNDAPFLQWIDINDAGTYKYLKEILFSVDPQNICINTIVKVTSQFASIQENMNQFSSIKTDQDMDQFLMYNEEMDMTNEKERMYHNYNLDTCFKEKVNQQSRQTTMRNQQYDNSEEPKLMKLQLKADDKQQTMTTSEYQDISNHLKSAISQLFNDVKQNYINNNSEDPEITPEDKSEKDASEKPKKPKKSAIPQIKESEIREKIESSESREHILVLHKSRQTIDFFEDGWNQFLGKSGLKDNKNTRMKVIMVSNTDNNLSKHICETLSGTKVDTEPLSPDTISATIIHCGTRQEFTERFNLTTKKSDEHIILICISTPTTYSKDDLLFFNSFIAYKSDIILSNISLSGEEIVRKSTNIKQLATILKAKRVEVSTIPMIIEPLGELMNIYESPAILCKDVVTQYSSSNLKQIMAKYLNHEAEHCVFLDPTIISTYYCLIEKIEQLLSERPSTGDYLSDLGQYYTHSQSYILKSDLIVLSNYDPETYLKQETNEDIKKSRNADASHTADSIRSNMSHTYYELLFGSNEDGNYSQFSKIENFFIHPSQIISDDSQLSNLYSKIRKDVEDLYISYAAQSIEDPITLESYPKEMFNKIANVITKSKTVLTDDYAREMKVSFIEHLYDYIYDSINSNECLGKDLVFYVSQKKTESLMNVINQIAGQLDSMYEQTKETVKGKENLDLDQIKRKSMKYVLAVKEAVHEVTIKILNTEDLENSIKTDF